MKYPTVSIITATYNSEKQILQTYSSLCDQSIDDWEWLVSDDCSTDSTVSILRGIAEKDSRVSIFCQRVNSGAAKARNVSLSKAKGEFLAFIDSDDIWLPKKLSYQIEFMEKESIDFSFTAYELIGEKGNQLNKTVDVRQIKNKFSYKDMLKKSATLGCSTVMLRNDVFSDLMMPDYRTGQDYAFWLKLLKETDYAFLLPVVLTKYRILPGSISRNKFKKVKRQWQLYRELEGLSFHYALLCMFYYGYRVVRRR